MFSFIKLRPDESSRSSETTTTPRAGPITPSPDIFFTPEMGVKTDLSVREILDVIKRLESAIGMTNENQNKLIENQKSLNATQNKLIANKERLDAVVKDNTKDIKEL